MNEKIAKGHCIKFHADHGQKFLFFLNIRKAWEACERYIFLGSSPEIFWIQASRYGAWEYSFF